MFSESNSIQLTESGDAPWAPRFSVPKVHCCCPCQTSFGRSLQVFWLNTTLRRFLVWTTL